METNSVIFTLELIETMQIIKNGAVIFGYITALRCQKLQALDGGLINIIPVKDLSVSTPTINNQGEHAYFSAILTAKGCSLLQVLTQ